ncbi:hypothetical protein KP77_31350 [Jeotgalibacillus alimentarius]|uniref:Uncharacterized protein n=2 Tax=Jeotgalibacillus alimentarius TaxID=135826 RepID=A0A0C2RNU8_9BACL|nr:hypothetical protein KP77_31350 [Jeotgalibacillus alimentarius]
MVNDRNLTVHTYNEEVATKIQSNLEVYYPSEMGTANPC